MSDPAPKSAPSATPTGAPTATPNSAPSATPTGAPTGAGPARQGPAIILVHAQLGENIGTAARAMLNCALTDLRLVAPRDGWPNPQAVAASSGADRVLELARVYPTTAAAIADLTTVYATTARPRDMVKPVLTPAEAAGDARARAAAGERIGFLFGAEKAGLTNEDVVLARAVVTVPLNPGFTSLNLAQSVLLIGYELFRQGDATPPRVTPTGASLPAHMADQVYFLERLEDRLERNGFFTTPNLKPVMVRNLRNIFLRADLTDQELRTLHGVVSSLCREFRRRDSADAEDAAAPGA